MFSGALTHSEILFQSASTRRKSNVNSPGISYGLNIESTRISFPKSGASSSTISSSSVLPEARETERELEELAPSERLFKTAIGGGEIEEREISMSLSELLVRSAVEERLVDASPLPLRVRGSR